jgi:hypothetical protein
MRRSTRRARIKNPTVAGIAEMAVMGVATPLAHDWRLEPDKPAIFNFRRKDEKDVHTAVG